MFGVVSLHDHHAAARVDHQGFLEAQPALHAGAETAQTGHALQDPAAAHGIAEQAECADQDGKHRNGEEIVGPVDDIGHRAFAS